MDTILQPRHLCSTASDSSLEEEVDNLYNKKDSTCSSKITVIPNVCSFEQVIKGENEGPDEDDGTTKIVCPTARFLQVNPKKVSSFDLLVRPAKRQRVSTPPSREDAAKGAVFNQKTSPTGVCNNNSESGNNRKKSPVLECIYFENEKLSYRQTKTGNWSSSSTSANPRNLYPPNGDIASQPSLKPASLPRILSEENTLREIELSEGYNRDFNWDDENWDGNVGCGSGERQEEYEDGCKLQGKQFPISENYAFYTEQWTPSVQYLFKEYEKESRIAGMFRDENLNFLIDKKTEQIEGEFEIPSPVLAQPSPRRIKIPRYQLRKLNEAGTVNGTNDHQDIGSPEHKVFLKESDFNSLTELSLFQQDEKKRNKPDSKKLKSNPPGNKSRSGYEENDEIVKPLKKKCEQPSEQLAVYQIYNELTGETEIERAMEEIRLVPPSSSPVLSKCVQEKICLTPRLHSEVASTLYRTCYDDESSMFGGTGMVGENGEEFSVIHHPDLRDLQPESTNALDEATFPMGVANGNGGDVFQQEFQEELEFTEEEDDDDEGESRPISALMPGSGTKSSPLTIFLSESIMGGSGLDHQMRFEMGASPFMNFGTMNENIFGEEGDDDDDGEWTTTESRIEDVTDLVGDDEVVDNVIHMMRSGVVDGRGGGSEMETLFWASSSGNTRAAAKDSSGSSQCQLVDGFTDKRTDKNGNKSSREMICISRKSLDPQEVAAQEFLLQPKPKLNLSSSVHSCLEQGCCLLEHRSTVAMFVDKNRTKSDYFVGKIKRGPSKSFPEFSNKEQNSKIKNNTTNKLPVSFHDSGNGNCANIVVVGGDLEEPLEHRNSHHQPPTLHRSSSSIAIAVTNAKRKVSAGNRVNNVNKVISPLIITPLIPKKTGRDEIQQLRCPPPLLRPSSSSSSHHQISMKIKAAAVASPYPPPSQKNSKRAPKNPPEEAKSFLNKEKKRNIFLRILGRFFRISEKPKDSSKNNKKPSSSSRTPVDIIPSVPSSVLKRSDHGSRGIVHHTDSKELYRERRRKFFNEQKEFRDDSLATYVQGILSHDNSPGTRDFLSIPLNYFLDKPIAFSHETSIEVSGEDPSNNNVFRTTTSNNNHQERITGDNVVPVQVRLAKSESALATPTSPNDGRQHGGGRLLARANLVLQFPPFVQVLAAAMTKQRSIPEGQQGHDFERVKQELKKPLKGILKKPK